jgi:serine/threonine protein kinase
MTEIDILESISNFELNFPHGMRNVSDDLKHLLSMMLEKDPTRRPDISEIKSLSRFLNNFIHPPPTNHSSEGNCTSSPVIDRRMSDCIMDSSSLGENGVAALR